ncbi:MAG TPA: SBBP repeat-containing protein [bacterium]|nr:SBBP repeat-containing protein [bacterium]HPS30058.1 SBBP repeat-containing protein [bacterium]
MKNKLIFTFLLSILLSFLSCGNSETGSENDNENPDSGNINDDDGYPDGDEFNDFVDSDGQNEITYEISVETTRFEGTTCNDISIDGEGNIYIVGEKHNEAYLAKIGSDMKEKWRIVWNEDSWQGADAVKVVNDYIYVSGNMMDYNFFSKFDGEGNEIWNKTTDLSIYAISIDKNENIYIGGKTNVENEEEPDAFFAKYDKNGEQVWLKNFGNENYEVIRSIALDSENNIYGAGFKAINNSVHTQFTVKYNSNGAYQWERVTGDGYLWATTVDGQDKIFSTGVKNGSIILYEFNSAGTNVSEKNFGSGVGMGLDHDKNSNLYLSGYTTGAFEGFSNKGAGDSFLIKMDGLGNELWATQWGSEYNEQWQKVAVGLNGEIYVTHYEHVLVTDDEYYDNMNRVIISKITEKVK